MDCVWVTRTSTTTRNYAGIRRFRRPWERSEVLASQATLCRLEHRMDRQAAVALHRVLVETVHRFSQETTPQVDSRLRCHR